MVSHAGQVIRNGVNLVSIQFIGTLLSVVTTAYIARILSTTEMAIYGAFYIIYGLIALLRGLGFVDCLIKRFPALIAKNQQNEAYRLAKTIFITTTYILLALLFLVFIASTQISQILLKTNEFAYIIRLFIPGLFFYCLFEINLAILWARQQLTSYAVYQVALTILLQLLAIAGWYWRGIDGFVLGFSSAIVIVTLISLRPNLPLLLVEGHSPLKPLVRYCFPFYLATFTRYGLTQADQLLVGIFLSPQSLGIYFFIKRFADQLRIFLDSSFIPLAPKLSEMSAGDTKSIGSGLKRGVQLLAQIMIPPIILVASSSHLIITIFGGDKYLSGSIALTVLILSLIVYAYYSLVAITIYIFREPIERFKIEIIPGILSIVILALLVPQFELIGAALAMTLSLLVGLLWGAHKVKSLEISFNFIWSVPIQAILLWLPLGLAIYFVQTTYDKLMVSIIISLVGGLVYLLYLWKNGFYHIFLTKKPV